MTGDSAYVTAPVRVEPQYSVPTILMHLLILHVRGAAMASTLLSNLLEVWTNQGVASLVGCHCAARLDVV
jgi:predicted alpha/beta-hydrolase family hydrolase